jgi:hypothetical protein
VTPTPEHQENYVAILCQVLRESEDPLLRLRAAQSLGKQGNKQAIETLLEHPCVNCSDGKSRLNQSIHSKNPCQINPKFK